MNSVTDNAKQKRPTIICDGLGPFLGRGPYWARRCWSVFPDTCATSGAGRTSGTRKMTSRC